MCVRTACRKTGTGTGETKEQDGYIKAIEMGTTHGSTVYT